MPPVIVVLFAMPPLETWNVPPFTVVSFAAPPSKTVTNGVPPP